MTETTTDRRRRVSRRRTLLTIVATAALVAPLTAYAGDSFSDVPDSNIFHDDIDWMADNGVTAGCGGDRFCPSDTVTREQMSAFMRRLDSQDVFTTPAEVAAAAPRFAVRTSTARITDDGDGDPATELTRLQITVPAAGTVLVEHSGQYESNGDVSGIFAYLTDRTTSGRYCVNGGGSLAASGAAGSTTFGEFESVALSGAAYVDVPSAGTYTYVLCMNNSAATPPDLGSHVRSTVRATWFPTATATSTGPQYREAD